MRHDFAPGLGTSVLELMFKCVSDYFLLDEAIQEHYVLLRELYSPVETVLRLCKCSSDPRMP